VTLLTLAAIAAPLLVLLATRADLHHFFRDSFVIIPRSIDAVWSLPAKPLPRCLCLCIPLPCGSGWPRNRPTLPGASLLWIPAGEAIRKRDMRIAIVAIF